MPLLAPTTLDEALVALAEHPDATLLAGGTDAMVDINEGRTRPGPTVVALNRVAELRSWRHVPGEAGNPATVRVGGAVTWTELAAEPLASWAPALAEAARTVGSPQIRNAGTLGGNLATCSPAGDGLTVLSALDATVELAGPHGGRTMPVADFMTGVKRTAIRPGEVIAGVEMPVVDGWQGFAKVGVRNAMVIAVVNACVVLDRTDRRASIALGAVGPTILRATEAEAHVAEAIDWTSLTVSTAALAEVRSLVEAAARPITDHRSTEQYRRHAVGVLVTRLLRRAADNVRP